MPSRAVPKAVADHYSSYDVMISPLSTLESRGSVPIGGYGSCAIFGSPSAHVNEVRKLLE